MNDKQLERLKEALLILERLPAEQRASWIESRLRDDPQIKSEVHRLLASDELAANALAPLLQAPPAFLVNASMPTSIGPFAIEGIIGQGSAGIVYRGVQTAPIARRVAIKVLRSGLAARQLLSRFESERHALAKMEHRNIARLIDAGAAESGQAFIAIELIDGPPITEYARLHQFSPRQRIELFTQICRGVQHAHARGVLHRDLKPSNILVAEEDASPVPKVIDFGLAKLLESDPASPGQTEIGQVLGTLSYMSPEQADPSRPIADVRSDVYSLGVLLYELLTDTLPLPTARFEGLSIHQIHDLLQRHRATPPSRLPRGSSLTASPSRASVLTSELDCLVLKALEPDPEHRYASVADLLADLDRYLTGRAILARPPKFTYLARKFVERNKLPVVACTLVLFALIAGLLLATFGLRQAIIDREQAQRALSESEQVSAYLRDLFMQAHPTRLGPKASLETLLDTAAKEFLRKPPESLLVRAEVAAAIAEPLYIVGDYATVEKLLTPQLDPLADVKDKRAQELLTRAYMRLGYVSSRQSQIELAEQRLRKAADLARQTGSPTLEYQTQGALAQTYSAAGEFDKAIEMLEGMLRSEVAQQDPLLRASALSNLGSALGRKGDYIKGLPFSKEGYEIRLKLTPKDPSTLNMGWQLGISYMENSMVNDAVEIFEKNYTLAKDALGESHPDVVAGVVMIGFAKARRGDGPGVLPAMLQAIEQQRASNLPLAQLAQNRAYYAGALLYTQQRDAAVAEANSIVAELEAQFAACDVRITRILLQLGTIFSSAGAPSDSLGILQKAFDCTQKDASSGPLGPRVAYALRWSFQRLNDQASSQKWLETARALEARSSKP